MQRCIPAIFAALTAAVVFFTGCPMGGDDTYESAIPGSEDGKTYILFKNTGPYAVDVYSDSGRGSKVAAIPAGGESQLEWTPSPDGYAFYLSYQIPIGDDVIIPYNPPAGSMTIRIDKGKTTPLTIGSPVSSSALLTDQVYLLLYNESDTAAFRLVKQVEGITPQKIFGSGGSVSTPTSNLVNPHERAWYTAISAGSAANYGITVNGVPIPFPETEFQAGWFYTMRYVDGGLTLDTEYPLSLAELQDYRAPAGISVETQYLNSSPFILLTWQRSVKAVSYTVYRQADGEEAFVKLATTDDSGYSFKDTGVSELRTYAYKVGAVFDSGEELVSKAVSITIKQSYAITIQGAAGGVITSKSSRASEGTLVVLTVTPNAKYQLKVGSLQYHDGSDHLIDDGTLSFTMPAHDVTVSAEFEIVFYTVTFDADGGSPATQTKAVNSGDSVGSENMPSEPAKSGYGFGGWYTKKNAGGSHFTADTAVRASLTVYARWIPQYTVTFDADGGSPATQTKTVTSNSSIGEANMPQEPAKSKYSFNGWYTEKNAGGSHFTADTTVSASLTVYANWIPQYTVTFDADGGTPATQAKTVISSSSIGAANMPEEPAKSEYSFDGWYTAKNGGGSRLYATSAITEDITVYAKWTVVQYTVTFDADGGTPATQTKVVNSGDSIGSENMPSEPAKSGYSFNGWYTAKNGGGAQFTGETTITGNRTVYAYWTFIPMPDNLSLASALTWLNTNAADGGEYTITLSSVNESIAPTALSYSERPVKITITGGGSECTVSLSSTGSLFTVGSGVTLTLGNNVTLRGKSNSASLVKVDGGTLEMKGGSKIRDNTVSSSSSAYGGGVYVETGTFIMSGGTISGNSVTASSSAYGGGVYVGTGTFTMSGGTISGNIASASYAAYGGGVYVETGTFIKQSGGIIYGSNALDEASKNTAENNGQAVYVYSGNKMRDATAGEGITLNSAASGAAGGWE
ncbi:MAG: InlB B-repeat-containing protein [Treponema sp.]|nr:InlB B-repeat-containing protein [Treponema sp.]